MSLNLDWSEIELYMDPVPGDPAGVRQCAAKARSKASTVDSLRDDVSRIRSGHDNRSVFVGKAADKFISKLDDFPSNLSSLSTGLNTISQTLDSWSYCMEDCQHRAGNAYNRAVEAKNRASDANSKLDRALGDAANAGMALQVVKRTLGVVGDDADVRRAQRRVDAAQGQVDSFRSQWNGALDSYDRARRDVIKAGGEYNNDAEIAARGLNGALDDLPPVSVFDRVYYSDTWRTIVKVAEIANLVVTVAMLFLGPGGILGLLAFALAATGFLNDLLAYSHGDENLLQVGLGLLSMFLAGAPGVLGKQSAAGLRFFTESKGLPMYQRVIGGLNSYGRNSGMVTDIDAAMRQSNYKLLENSGFANQPKEKLFEFFRALPDGPEKEATRLFNDYQLWGLLPHDWKWLLEKSDLYGVFNPADAATIMRYGLDASRRDLRADAMKNVVKDMIDAERRVEDHKAEGKTGFGADLTEWAGLLAPVAPVLGLVGEAADSML
ncbi:WXG100 family type VII secretion target [Bifidobacterium apicola]|uniref:WXG100 family type VII secretion target n=1 Tax=Bifidobacterium apicola TaxID=3230739 RepID=UPI0036F35879